MLARLRCALKGLHDPLERHPLGGWRCGSCKTACGDLHDAGYVGGSHVPPMRRLFTRDNGGTLERFSIFDNEKRGGW
jgi:hypothetical protein